MDREAWHAVVQTRLSLSTQVGAGPRVRHLQVYPVLWAISADPGLTMMCWFYLMNHQDLIVILSGVPHKQHPLSCPPFLSRLPLTDVTSSKLIYLFWTKAMEAITFLHLRQNLGATFSELTSKLQSVISRRKKPKASVCVQWSWGLHGDSWTVTDPLLEAIPCECSAQPHLCSGASHMSKHISCPIPQSSLRAVCQFSVCKTLLFPRGLSVKESAYQYRKPGDRVWSLGWGNPLQEGMATHCSVLA